jgi:hypothetical protein
MACFWQAELEYIRDNAGSDPNRVPDITSGVFEILFCIDMILCFFKAYTSETDNKVVSKSGEILEHYLATTFALDIIPLVPLQYIILYNNR